MRVRNHQPGIERPGYPVPRTGGGRGGGRVRYRGTYGKETYTWGGGSTWAMYSVVYVQRGRVQSGVNTARHRAELRRREWQGIEKEVTGKSGPDPDPTCS